MEILYIPQHEINDSPPPPVYSRTMMLHKYLHTAHGPRIDLGFPALLYEYGAFPALQIPDAICQRGQTRVSGGSRFPARVLGLLHGAARAGNPDRVTCTRRKK